MNINILLVIGAIICWGIEDFLAQKSARKIGDVESLFFITLIGTIILLPFAIKDFNMLFSKQNLMVLLALTLIHFIGALFYFESLKRGKLSVVDVIFEFELPITIVFGIFLIKEYISSFQAIMMGVLFVGIILIAIKSFSHFKAKLEKGIFFAFIAAIFFGLTNFFSAFSSRITSPVVSLWFVWLMMCILSLIWILSSKNFKFIIKGERKLKLMMLFMGLTATFAWLFYFMAVAKEKIAVVTAITEIYPAISVTLGVLINKEKIKHHQVIGIILAIVSAVILGFTL